MTISNDLYSYYYYNILIEIYENEIYYYKYYNILLIIYNVGNDRLLSSIYNNF